MQKTDKKEKKIVLPHLKEIRDYFSLNQTDFAKLLDIEQNYFSRYENGIHEFPDELKIKLIDSIQKTYEKRINIDWFLTGQGSMFLQNHLKPHALKLLQIRERLNLDRKTFAKEMGITLGKLDEIENSGISVDFIKKLQEKYNVRFDWFYNDKGKMFEHDPDVPESASESRELTAASKGYRVPLLRQKVSCGSGVDWQDEANIVDYIDVFDLIPKLKIKRLFAFCVDGNSMVGAGIRNGDYVLFDSALDQKLHDGIYVFALDGEVYCKQLEFDSISQKIKIYSIRVANLEKAELLTTIDNKDMIAVERLKIFGRVIYWVHPCLEDK